MGQLLWSMEQAGSAVARAMADKGVGRFGVGGLKFGGNCSGAWGRRDACGTVWGWGFGGRWSGAEMMSLL